MKIKYFKRDFKKKNIWKYFTIKLNEGENMGMMAINCGIKFNLLSDMRYTKNTLIKCKRCLTILGFELYFQ